MQLYVSIAVDARKQHVIAYITGNSVWGRIAVSVCLFMRKSILLCCVHVCAMQDVSAKLYVCTLCTDVGQTSLSSLFTNMFVSKCN